MTIDDSESEDENHFVGNRYNNDDSDSDSEVDFYNLPSVGSKRKFSPSVLQAVQVYSSLDEWSMIDRRSENMI